MGNVYLYYKGRKNWNPFSQRLGPPYSSQRPHLSAREVWQEMWRPMIFTFLKRFCQNVNTFYTKHFCLPTFVPTYYFPCVTLACILFFSKISLFTFLIHLELINYLSCVTLACIIFFSKISLFTFLTHLELTNYFPCVTLACIFFFLKFLYLLSLFT